MYSVQPDKLKKCKIQIKKDSQDGCPFFMLFWRSFLARILLFRRINHHFFAGGCSYFSININN